MPIEMTHQDRQDGINQITLTGTLDVASVTESNLDTRFNAAVAARREPTIVDLSSVDSISSLGMGVLVGCAASLKRRGAGMVLMGAQPDVARALEIARIDKIVPLVSDEQQAIEVLRAPQVS